jgi:hypothetical protein
MERIIMTAPKKDEKVEKETPVKVIEGVDALELFSDIDDKSVQASLDAGVILQQLKPVLNRVYEVIVCSLPKSFVSNFGKTFAIDIEHDKMLKSLILPKSLKFQLNVEMRRNGLVDKNGQPDLNQLIGKTLLVQKIIGDTKNFKNAKLYSVQIKQ